MRACHEPTVNLVDELCRESITANDLKWAYRTNLEDAKDLDKHKRPVLLLHGIGSASFSYRYGLSFHSLRKTDSLSKCELWHVYRETCEMLGAEGYRAIAADWPGHGSSDKVNMHADCAADLCSYT